MFLASRLLQLAPAHAVRATCVAVALMLALLPHPAHALAPLTAFLAGAEEQNPDVIAARASAVQKQAEHLTAVGKLLPGVSLAAAYTRNEFQAKLPIGTRTLSIAPYNQLDAAVTLTIPVLDVVAWAKRAIAAAEASRGHHQARQATVEVGKQVVSQYYQLRASEGVLLAAERSHRVAEEQARLVHARLSAGAASTLDAAQADSDVAAAEQNVASADLAVSLGRRMLCTLTGVVAEPGDGLGEVSLAPEAPLGDWQRLLDPTLPSLAQSRAALRAARAGYEASRFAYMPSINLTGTERFTNASALNGGHMNVWQAKANLNWAIDVQLLGVQKAQGHILRAALAQASKARSQAADQLFSDYRHIEANRAKSLAARSQVKATSLAESLAQEKRDAGVITQFDVLQARRDAFVAEINRISADADLLAYRALLRLDAGLGALCEGPMP